MAYRKRFSTVVTAAGPRSIYVASSWRNQRQPQIVSLLRSQGHRVYDFKRPDGGAGRGFRWEDAGLWHSNPVDGDLWAPDLADADDYVTALSHPAAIHGFERDLAAMVAADTFVLVLPCGRSAHLELGWAVGAKKSTAVLLDDPCTPELMYRLVGLVTAQPADLIEWLEPSTTQTPTCARTAKSLTEVPGR
jgi:hypothetical protein